MYIDFRGLDKFIQNKKLSRNQAINAFLIHCNVTDFTAKKHTKSNMYVLDNWTKFCSFVDNGIKTGRLKGRRVKLNHYYDEERERKENVKKELTTLTKEQNSLMNLIKNKDCLLHMSKTNSFFNKKGHSLPANQEGLSRKFRIIPRIDFMLNSELISEFKEYLKAL